MSKYFSKEMKLADLMVEERCLLLTLPRLGIKLGFGEKSVEEVCRENGVPVDFAMMIFRAYTDDGFTADDFALRHTDMSPLVSYLTAEHRYYVDSYIPHIDRHVHHVAEKIGGRMCDMLKKFFDDYADEVAEHFRYEEKEIFPLLRNDRKAGKRRISDRIRSCIDRSHEEIEVKLADLSQIIYKYLPPEVASDEVIELLFDIFHLADDLRTHEKIEEKILLPYIDTLAL